MDTEPLKNALEKTKETLLQTRETLNRQARELEKAQKKQLILTLVSLTCLGILLMIWAHVSTGFERDYLLNLSSGFLGGTIFFLILYLLWERFVSQALEIKELTTRTLQLTYQTEAVSNRMLEILDDPTSSPDAKIETILLMHQSIATEAAHTQIIDQIKEQYPKQNHRES